MDGEDALDTNTVGDLADREGLADAAAAPRDADPLEGLQALLVAFADPDVHAERVTGTKGRDILPQPLFLRFDERVHIWLGSGGRADGTRVAALANPVSGLVWRRLLT